MKRINKAIEAIALLLDDFLFLQGLFAEKFRVISYKNWWCYKKYAVVKN
jgi:hypothetical protein